VTDPDLELRIFGANSLRVILQRSTLEPSEGLVPSRGSNLLDVAPPLPRWPSGLYSDFDALVGGFSGVTAIAGPSGSGKSLIALACALENVLIPGTLVVYFDAENSEGDQSQRATQWFGASYFREQMLEQTLNFHWHEVLPGHTYEQLLSFAARRLLDHERVLLVFDSVTSIARRFRGRNLDNLSNLWQALAHLVRQSAGRIGVLGLSELNGRGDLLGLQGVYDSTLGLKLEADTERGDSVYQMRMLKHRNGELRRDLGLYSTEWSSCRLVRYEKEFPRRFSQADA
jgi:hypothetical protein